MAVARVGTNGTPVNSTTAAASVTVNMPTGLSVGHIVVVAVNTQPGATPAVTFTTPAGWNAVTSIAGNTFINLGLFWRAYQAGDPSTVSFAWTGNTAPYGAVAVAYSGANTTTPFGTPQTNAETANTLNPVLKALTTTGTGSMTIAVLALGSNSTTITAEPTGYALNNQGGVSADTAGKRIHLSDRANASPTTVAASTWTVSATGRANSIHVELLPAGGAVATPIRRVGKYVF